MIRRRTGKKAKNVEVDFSEVFDKVKKTLYKKTATSMQNGFESIVSETPVKTGYAQSSWRVTVGSAFSDDLEDKEDDTDYKDPNRIISQGKQVIDRIRKEGFGDPVYFYSGVEYMGKLEYGHSSQNKFFIRRAVTKMKKEISEFKKKGF